MAKKTAKAALADTVKNAKSKKDLVNKAAGLPTVDEQIENTFKEAIEGLTIICKAQIRNANRIDNLFNTYKALEDFGLFTDYDSNETKVQMAQDSCESEVENYEMILDLLPTIKLEDMIADEYHDPIAMFIPERFGVQTLKDAYHAYLVFVCFRPYGEKLEQLRKTLLDIKNSEK